MHRTASSHFYRFFLCAGALLVSIAPPKRSETQNEQTPCCAPRSAAAPLPILGFAYLPARSARRVDRALSKFVVSTVDIISKWHFLVFAFRLQSAIGARGSRGPAERREAKENAQKDKLISMRNTFFTGQFGYRALLF